MNERSEAIILHALRHSDTSTIVHAYTRQRGHITFVINGGTSSRRSSRSSVRRLMTRPLSLVEVDYALSGKRELLHASDVRSLHSFETIDSSPERSAMALFLSELLYRTLRFPNGDEPLFDYLRSALLALDDPKTAMGNFHLVFLMQYIAALGLSPHTDSYSSGALFDMEEGSYVAARTPYATLLPTDESAALYALRSITFEDSTSVRFPAELKQRLIRSLIEYLRIHLGNFPPLQSLDVIYTLFA